MNLPVAEACLRNQAPIAECLQSLLPEAQSVLEIGSGTGQHAVYVCKQLPYLLWQPSELAERVQEVEAWRHSEQLENVLACKTIDVNEIDWNLNTVYNTVFTANTLHYISWESVNALFNGASKYLEEKGNLIVYGPFNQNQSYTSEGNRQLDAWLKQRDPESGIKDREAIINLASEKHLRFVNSFQMPANNLILQFTKVTQEA